MSVNVQSPLQSHVDGLAPSQVSLYSETKDSIAEICEEESPPVASLSPSISSFTSYSCSQSVLKDAPFVSSDPTVVGKFSSECGANSNITSQVAIDLDNCNVTGPKVAQGNSNDNVMGPNVAQNKSNGNCKVTGPKVAQGKSNSNVTGPKVAQGSSNGNVTGPNAALNKSNSNVTGPKVAPSKGSVTGSKTHNSTSKVTGPGVAGLCLNDAPNSQNSQISQNSKNSQIVDDAMDSDSSSSESSFKAPLPPRPRRTPTPSAVRGRSRPPLVPVSPGAHRGMPQVSKDKPSKRS